MIRPFCPLTDEDIHIWGCYAGRYLTIFQHNIYVRAAAAADRRDADLMFSIGYTVLERVLPGYRPQGPMALYWVRAELAGRYPFGPLPRGP